MAWRDSRGQRRMLLLFAVCIVFGIAALVAIRSFRENLKSTIEAQAQTLLGADLSLKSRQRFSDRMEGFIEDLGGEQSREVRFQSMAFFPGPGTTRLVQVRALDGRFPFYGGIKTDPEGAEFRGSGERLALVEDSLMAQFGVAPGDVVKIGAVTFRIAGRLLQISGENEMRGLFSPRVFIDRQYLAETGLIQRGSMTRYRAYIRYPEGLSVAEEERLERLKKGLFAEEGVRFDTVAEEKRDLGRNLENLYDFLNLVGFIALLLGGLGVAGGVQVYLKEKLNTVAILRCVGVRMRQIFAIYILQIAAVGFVGSFAGAGVGVCVQFFLPMVLSFFLPFSVDVFVSWSSVLLSVSFGFGVTVLFALIPLLSVRAITPLQALRASFEDLRPLRKDPGFWIVFAVIVALVLSFCLTQTSEVEYGLGFAGGLAGSLILLSGLSVGVRWLVKRYFPKNWPYPWRQGLSNLYRPNNRTLFLIVTLGMGTFLICTIYLVQGMLLRQVSLTTGGSRANVVFFDIQPDQVDGVVATVRRNRYPVQETVPIVTMRLAEINGRTARELREDRSSGVERWTLNWEYRSTFRSSLIDTESIIEGAFTPVWTGGEPIPISIEENIARDLNVHLGDAILFDVQGVPLAVKIDSIRKVDWARLRPNFYMLFPAGVLEDAPAFYALLTRVPDRRGMADLQQEMVKAFPNVSAIDLSIVLDTITAILSRIAFVIRFMASFTVATGIVVLAGAMVTSRYQRIRESVLLATLGATGSVIRRILTVEYLLLGFLGGIAGTLLALVASWALAYFLFEIPYSIDWAMVPTAVAAVCALTVATGWLNSRGIAGHPPLAVLREEG